MAVDKKYLEEAKQTTKDIILPLKQRDVTYRRMHTLTYGELKTMTYAELQNKYYEVVAPKTKSIRLVEPIKEVTI